MLQYSDLEVTLYFAHCIYPIMVVDTTNKIYSVKHPIMNTQD